MEDVLHQNLGVLPVQLADVQAHFFDGLQDFEKHGHCGKENSEVHGILLAFGDFAEHRGVDELESRQLNGGNDVFGLKL